MPWHMQTDPLARTVLSALVACLSILYLFRGLAWKRMKGHWAALSTLGIAVAISILGFACIMNFSGMAIALGNAFSGSRSSNRSSSRR